MTDPPSGVYLGEHHPLPHGWCRHRWRNRQTRDVVCPYSEGYAAGQAVAALNVGVEQLAGILASAGTMRFDPTHTEAVIEGRLARHGIDYEYIAEWLRGRLRLDAETLARLWREEEITDLDVDCPHVEYEATANAVLQRLFGAER
jgi:hypothetical protein